MEMNRDITKMQQVSDYRTMVSILRKGGIGSIVFGLIGIAIGATAISENPVNAILVTIGAALVIEGIWVVSVPSPAGAIAEGLAMLVVGIWNILVTIHNMSAGGSTPIFGVLGAYQVYWAFQSFGRYSRFAGLSLEKPPKEILAQVDEMVKAVLSAKSCSENTIEFQEGNKSWKGMFFGEMAVLVKNGGEDVIFTDREEMSIADKKEEKKGKLYRVELQIRNRRLESTISTQAFSMYERWRLAAA